MARLSVEHDRVNAAMTPENTRKANRFRDMFKRSSASPQAAANPTEPATKLMQPSSPTSPLSPTVKPGFEKIGFLPSERSSLLDATKVLEDHGGSNLADVLARQEVELKGVSVPHNLNTCLGISQATHADEAAQKEHMESKTEEASFIAEAFKDALTRHQEDHAKGEPDAGEGQCSPPRPSDLGGSRSLLKETAVPQSSGFTRGAVHENTDSDEEEFTFPKLKTKPAFKATMGGDLFGIVSDADDFKGDNMPKERVSIRKCLRGNKMSVSEARSQPSTAKSISEPHDSDVDDEDELSDRPSNRGSSASNIFDNKDPLSQGIREYVASKIAEALLEHERKNMGEHPQPCSTEKTATKLSQLNFHVNISGFKKNASIKKDGGSPVNQAMLNSAKMIGPFVICHVRLAAQARSTIVMMYGGLILITGLRNGTCILSTLWDIVYFITMYILVMRQFGYFQETADLEGDIIVAPVFSVAVLVAEKAISALRKVLKAVVILAVEALQEVADNAANADINAE